MAKTDGMLVPPDGYAIQNAVAYDTLEEAMAAQALETYTLPNGVKVNAQRAHALMRESPAEFHQWYQSMLEANPEDIET